MNVVRQIRKTNESLFPLQDEKRNFYAQFGSFGAYLYLTSAEVFKRIVKEHVEGEIENLHLENN
jgi:hypothetical protein